MTNRETSRQIVRKKQGDEERKRKLEREKTQATRYNEGTETEKQNMGRERDDSYRQRNR